ncbi:MAG: toxin [Gammaproteobacteria bacterium GWF2_41_13]|nr:MAG: toxin [Gammaproteobacteria bacterium GWF2_41_13]
MTKLIYEFSDSKNQLLIQERHISFEEIIAALLNGQLLDIVDHPNTNKYPNQKMYVVKVAGYVYLVPFVKKDHQTIFLKTIFPSRKAKKHYLNSEEIGNDS